MRPNRITAALILLVTASLLAGCSSDDPVPVCDFCEIWDQYTVGLGRFPDPHPDLSEFLAFSTITKTPGAPDESREADEDIWLLWVNSVDDPTGNRAWQITADEMGISGDNFSPRWSPSGTQVAFVHTEETGDFEVWRVDVMPPAAPLDPDAVPVVGIPERLARTARDPEWISETELVFTREDKIYRIPVAPGPGPRAGGEVQLSFNPPIYTSTDEYVDRHPDVAMDGGAIFNSIDRQPVGTIFVNAFEIDETVKPPDTTATDAHLFLQAPGATGSYPLFDGPDTLQTPVTMASLPLGEGNSFTVGVRIDSLLLPDPKPTDPPRSYYCDSTLTTVVDVQPGDIDSLTFYFIEARGAIRVETGRALTDVFWTSETGQLTSDQFPGSHRLDNVGSSRVYECVPSFEYLDGVPTPPGYETYTVFGRSGTDTDVQFKEVPPGSTVTFMLFEPDPGAEPGEAPSAVRDAVRVSRTSGKASAPALRGGDPFSLGRDQHAGFLSTLWRMEFPTAVTADFTPVTGSVGLIQHPTLTDDLGGGLRYLAYVSDESGDWRLLVQRIVNWEAVGEPFPIQTPGSFDNLSCERAVFHPRFLSGTTSAVLRIVVAMADCPDNGFEDLDFDADPWAIGEFRIWQVEYTP